MQERLSAVRKPTSKASIPLVSGVQQKFNFGQDGQANVPPVSNMGSVKLVQQERHVHFQEGTKPDADTNPEPKSKPGWYYSEL